MIETLAYYGDSESQERLISILKYQLRLLGDYSANEKQRVLIETWKKQIKYFNEQLSLNSGQTVMNK